MIGSMVDSIWLVSVVVEVEVTRAGTPTSASLKKELLRIEVSTRQQHF